MLCFQKWHKYTVCIIPPKFSVNFSMRIKCIFYIDSNKKDSSHLCRTVHYFFRLRIKVIKISLSFSSKPSQISSISFCSFVRSNLLSSSEKLCDCNFKSITYFFQISHRRHTLLIQHISQSRLRYSCKLS